MSGYRGSEILDWEALSTPTIETRNTSQKFRRPSDLHCSKPSEWSLGTASYFTF